MRKDLLELCARQLVGKQVEFQFGSERLPRHLFPSSYRKFLSAKKKLKSRM